MRIAFYAPLKPPTSPRPSGDRGMARALMAALELAGHEVTLASLFRSRDATGDADRQRRLRQLGERLAARYLARNATQRPDLWFTYHVYYKAPDWIGPLVSRALDIPYVVAEASHAPKRAGGNWAIGHAGAEAAIRTADRIVGINGANAPCVLPLLDDPARLTPLAPFLDTAAFTISRRKTPAIDGGPLLMAVAMMRAGDKLASYRVLADTLTTLADRPWRLEIVGDGPARAEIETLMAPLGPDRVRFLGQRAAGDMPALLAEADICVWPAINEAYGMALLEAQAAGLPVVAGDAGGVSEIVQHGVTGLLAAAGDADALAAALNSLLADPSRRDTMGRAAMDKAARQHSLETAARRLDDIIQSTGHRRAA
ncbi:MAG: glycosyltransferase family 4 protein [Rhodospirillaceae bacterium]|jgi:glycosyltransferase involved in cell wall biosynthesis|nr:glycosyltransferase family 4 protein [Rhodospirillaceae bacterium]MBT5458216.1 glycosyltransferase family 4 protein [Rhodospirillaceae bacterium]